RGETIARWHNRLDQLTRLLRGVERVGLLVGVLPDRELAVRSADAVVRAPRVFVVKNRLGPRRVDPIVQRQREIPHRPENLRLHEPLLGFAVCCGGLRGGGGTVLPIGGVIAATHGEVFSVFLLELAKEAAVCRNDESRREV